MISWVRKLAQVFVRNLTVNAEDTVTSERLTDTAQEESDPSGAYRRQNDDDSGKRLLRSTTMPSSNAFNRG